MWLGAYHRGCESEISILRIHLLTCQNFSCGPKLAKDVTGAGRTSNCSSTLSGMRMGFSSAVHFTENPLGYI